jgi:hypothetical protein
VDFTGGNVKKTKMAELFPDFMSSPEGMGLLGIVPPEVLIPILRRAYPDVTKAMVLLRGRGNPNEVAAWMKVYGHMKRGINTELVVDPLSYP